MFTSFLKKLCARFTPWYERYFSWVVLGCVLLAMAISLSIGLRQSVWFDEGYSILVAKQSVGDLIHLTSVDTHPPLYYLLLKFWTGVFGWSEIALRSLSVLAMGGAMAIGIFLVKRLFGARVALFVLPLVILAPFLLRYGFEIRMYALGSLIGIAATYTLVVALGVKDVRAKWRSYSLYALLVVAGMLTLYYTAVLWIAHVLWLVWRARKEKRPLFKQPAFAAMGASVALFLPWLPVFISQLGNGALAPIAQPLTLENIVGIASFMFAYEPLYRLDAVMSLVVLLAIILAVYCAMKAFREASSKQRSYLVLLACYFMVPVALIALISLARPMYVERYLAQVLLGASLFVGVGVGLVAQKDIRKGLLLVATFTLILLLGVGQLAQVGNYNFQRLQKPMAKQILQEYPCQKGVTYISKEPYPYIDMVYYADGCDFRFYATYNPGDMGGYAPLHNSSLRITGTESLQARQLVLVDFNAHVPEMMVDERYHLVKTVSFDTMNVAVYER